MTTRKSLQLTPERHAQLEQLGKAFNTTTISATLGEVIRRFAAMGVIEHKIDGVDIHADCDGLIIKIGDNPRTALTLAAGRSMLDNLTDFLSGKESAPTIHNFDANCTMVRRGNFGLSISVPLDKSPKVFTLDLAKDFAVLLESALDRVADKAA